MNADRIERAMKRIEAAIQRIDTVRGTPPGDNAKSVGGSARVVELVNSHEKLREHVSETLRELDDLLAKLED